MAKITNHSASLAVLSIRLLRPDSVKMIPAELRKAAELGGYRFADTAKGKMSIRKGGAQVAPSAIPGFLLGLSAGDNGVRGWKLPGITDDTGERITLLRGLDASLGFRVVADAKAK